jgi:hypothetical protein
MSTGADISLQFDTQYDEIQSGYFSAAQKQRLFDTALTNVYQMDVDNFQATAKVTDELLAHIKTVTVTPGVNNSVDISPTSSVVPDYKLLTNAEVQFTVDTVVTRARASQVKSGAKYGQYGIGTTRNPKYEKVNDTLRLHPLSAEATEAVIDYITTPTPVTLTNALIEVPYTSKFIQNVVEEMLVQAAKANREYPFVQSSIQQEQINP